MKGPPSFGHVVHMGYLSRSTLSSTFVDEGRDVCIFGSKIGIDATRKWKEEGFNRRWPDVMEMDQDVVKKVEAILGRYIK